MFAEWREQRSSGAIRRGITGRSETIFLKKIKFFFFFFLIQRKNFFFFLNLCINQFNKNFLFRDFLFPSGIIFPGLNFSSNKVKLLIFYNLYKNLINNSFSFFQNNSFLEKSFLKKNKKICNAKTSYYFKLLNFLFNLYFFKKKILRKLLLKFLFLEFVFFKQQIKTKKFFLQNLILLNTILNKYKFINFFF